MQAKSTTKFSIGCCLLNLYPVCLLRRTSQSSSSALVFCFLFFLACSNCTISTTLYLGYVACFNDSPLRLCRRGARGEVSLSQISFCTSVVADAVNASTGTSGNS